MKTSSRSIRVMVAKPGLDGHDRGAKVLALGLMNEGMEVIYTGLRQTPESIVEAAIQEDVDVIGLSCLTGNHKYMSKSVFKHLTNKGSANVLVIVGGIVPPADIPYLNKIGVKGVFGPGSRIPDIAKFIRQNIRQ